MINLAFQKQSVRHLFIIFIALCIQSNSYAHKYYFGFAELEYNGFTQRFEGTLTVTTHDLELALKKNDSDAGDLVELTDEQTLIVENYINKGFSVSSGESTCSFKIVGHESKLDGTINLYMESTEISVDQSIDISFDLLMNTYTEQQNKVTLYHSDKMYTRAFTQGTKKQNIEINEE